MASFAPIRGTRAQIQATPIVDGQFLIETDQGVDNMIYIDEGSTRTIVGGNTISGVLPELYIYSETGSVVTVEDEGGNVIPTSQVGTDHWTCELPDYGVYTVTSVLSGETTTQSIDVNDCMIYTIDASHFHVNVVVTYPSGVGASCQISGGGETYSAPALNPPNTSYKFVVHGKNTTYTITTTVDGATKTATVTSGTTIDQTYEVTMSYGQINLTVETPPITGDITCTDSITTIIKPASANMVFYVPNTGTWDISGSDGSITYSTRAIVTSLSTPVSVGLNTGLNLASWITAGSTTEYPLNPSSYADFSALEADEAAIRQLMLVHDSVDYLATAPTGDNLMQNVINSDICAKWINLSDYALDTLGTNSDIAAEMDTADKYGYGEWGLKDAIPRLTSDTSASPSITLSSSGAHSSYPMWKAFDGDETTSGTPSGWMDVTAGAAYLEVDFAEPVKIGGFYVFIKNHPESGSVYPMALQAYVNGKWETIDTITYEITGSKVYIKANITTSKIRLYDSNTSTSHPMVISFQAYTWGALGNVPIMTANNAPYGTASRNSVTGSNEAYKAFSGSATATDRWLPNTNDTNNYLRFTFVNPVKAKKAKINFRHSPSLPQMTFSIRASNDGFTTYDTVGTVTVEAQSSAGNVEVEVDLTSNTYYMAYDLFCSTAMTITSYDIGVHSLQFYGRELTEEESSAPTDGREYVNIGSTYYTEDWGEKEFASGSTAKWIYDHGVELESMTAQQTNGTAEKESSQIYVKISTSNSSANVHTSTKVTFASGSYSRLRGIVGNKAQRTNGTALPLMYVDDSTYGETTFKAATISEVAQNPREAYTLDVSSIVGDKYIGYGASTSGTSLIDEGSLTELWLE